MVDEKPKKDSVKDPFALAGRRIAIGIYLVALGYMAVVGFYTVISELFLGSASATDASCAVTLVELRDELVSHASPEFEPQVDSTLSEEWLASWDARHRAARSSCGGAAGKPYRDLWRFRHRLELSMTRIDRDVRPLLSRFDRSLADLNQDQSDE